ncbi:S-adenosyl-L-methionine-dependent methyltransferase [Astrocystis sublimbata]|nr:S-adenosyl-L-methionine-dependent methyltransferase [Astrocystis sublimbata]
MAPSKTNDAMEVAEKIEQLLGESSDALNSLSESDRHRLSEAARKLNLATEAHGDSVHRILHSPLQLPLVLVGIETHLFENLVNHSTEGRTSAQLAEEAHVDPILMKRILRYYQAFGIVDQPQDDTYRANNITQAMTTLGARAGAPFYLGTLVPAFLRSTRYANVTDGANCPWFPGHGTAEPPFEWVQKRPDMLQGFMGWMSSHRDGLPTIFDAIDFEKEITSWGSVVDASTPVFVDIGGALGHQCIIVKQKYPNLTGRVVLQDLPHVIEQVKAGPLPGFEGIETQVYNFFEPQPLKGARAYYLRNILHDWTDEKCVEILQNIKLAMTAESKILIDEMVLPERGTPWKAAELDLAMGTCFAAMERSHSQWVALLDRAGLKVERVWKYTEQVDDCVIVAVPK